MAITINETNQVAAIPTVSLTGDIINAVTGVVTTGGVVIVDDNPSNQDVKTRSFNIFSDPNIVISTTGLQVTNRPSRIFNGNVVVDITIATAEYSASPYFNRNDQWNGMSGDIIGATQATLGFNSNASGGLPENTFLNDNAEIYYTINGKDPVRTKAYLFTSPFTVRHNAAGSDKVVLKAVTYWRGRKSPINRVEFRVVRLDANTV